MCTLSLWRRTLTELHQRSKSDFSLFLPLASPRDLSAQEIELASLAESHTSTSAFIYSFFFVSSARAREQTSTERNGKRTLNEEQDDDFDSITLLSRLSLEIRILSMSSASLSCVLFTRIREKRIHASAALSTSEIRTRIALMVC